MQPRPFRMPSKGSRAAALTALAIAGLIVACSDDGDPDGGGPDGGATTTTTRTNATTTGTDATSAAASTNSVPELSAGVTLVDWVDALIAGEPLDDVHCDQCQTS